MKILVTGAKGFVGNALAKALVKRVNPTHVLGIDKAWDMPFGSDAATVHLDDEWDVVFHMACSRMGACVDNPRQAYNDNLQTVINVATQTPSARQILASTSSNYHNGFLHRENSVLEPTTIYGASKLAAEDFLELTSKNYRILRFGNVYGPGHDPNDPNPGVIAKFVRLALARQPLPIVHNSTRDYVYIDDIVDGCIKAIHYGENGVYNLGWGIPTSPIYLVGLIEVLLERDVETTFMRPRVIDTVENKTLACNKAAKELFWTPTTTLGAGVKKTIDWQRS